MTTAIITAALIVALAILALAAVVIIATYRMAQTMASLASVLAKNYSLQGSGIIQAILAAALIFPDNLRNADVEAAISKMKECVNVHHVDATGFPDGKTEITPHDESKEDDNA